MYFTSRMGKGGGSGKYLGRGTEHKTASRPPSFNYR